MERYYELERAYSEILFGWQEIGTGGYAQKRRRQKDRTVERNFLEEARERRNLYERRC